MSRSPHRGGTAPPCARAAGSAQTDASRNSAPHSAFTRLLRAGVKYTNKRKIPQRSLLLLTLDISAV
nr:MAG TPA: hypothetical protein [Caudoviricetes sp.]